MEATGLLALAVGLVSALGLYRLIRWYWRPRLKLAGSLAPAQDGVIRGTRTPASPPAGRPRRAESHAALTLDVYNRGTRVARHCTARVVRLESREARGWHRAEGVMVERLRWVGGGAMVDIPPGATRALAAVHISELPPGRYLLTVAVLNGEERRGTYEFEIHDTGVGSPPASSRETP
jgi:hypothetical protein